jgi:glycosyltransferase involved in cell wall biosynthesis
MTDCNDITIVVGTYNPQWVKLKATLLSIVEQKNVKLQIVVSDDGSANPLHTEVKTFFKSINFTDYKLVKGVKHEGTVCQFYRGICSSDAEYIKLFSPGDLLYNDTVLSEWLAFSKKNNADIIFGDAVCYNRNNGKLNIIKSPHHPRNMSVYKNASSFIDKVINYHCLKDVIYGSTKIAKKSILLYYLRFLLHRVTYVEDYFIRLAILDERKIMYYPFKVIWYEYADGGISTTGDKRWKELMLKDDIKMDKICLEKWIKPNEEIRKWILENIEFKRNINRLSKFDKLIRLLKHPKWLYWRFYRLFFEEYSPINADVSFFKHCYGESNRS